ncbi:hypothetical protein DSCA_05690 [Desulfosarcina alkanivorans]|uniref:PAC domain-containing protein n=1 Tax=Desulfosarcina alkanivorans TaxID=571177 RepID=A0A5K7YFU1_9BACT|nr:hypothetical protein [Desulfosarcina alkanivorans]BBO66639.1 hypothetical protein DSCA_05690 [Desulfosarcina alkanivorans]
MTGPPEKNCKLLEENSFLKQKIQNLEQSLSERRGVEELLQLERELYIDLLKYQPAGIYRLRVFTSKKLPKSAWSSSDNPPYILELVNDRFCEILRINREIFKNNPGIIIDLIHPEDKAEFIRENEESNANMKPFMWEGRLSIGGKIHWIHFESLPRLVANKDVLWTGILYDITERKIQDQEMKELVFKLQKALEEIKTLRGIVPICANCKKIRDDKGFWDHVEIYVAKHTDAQFSHGICPSCVKSLYPEFSENENAEL